MSEVNSKPGRTKRFSYPCQNAIMKHLRIEIRYRLVHKTQSHYLNATNNSVPFKFDSIQISIQKIVFHDHWYWHMFRGKIEIQGFPKRKIVKHNISPRVQEYQSMTTICNFFLDRPGTVIKKLNVMSTEALEYIPNVYVSDEVIIWNHDYIPMDFYKKICPYKAIKKAIVYNDGGDLALFSLPMIATALEWHVHFDLPIKVFLDSMVQTVTWESHGIPYDTIAQIFENWKATNRPLGTYFQLKTANKVPLLEMASNLPTARVIGSSSPLNADSMVVLELDHGNSIRVYIEKKAGLIMQVVNVIEEPPRKHRCSCTIL